MTEKKKPRRRRNSTIHLTVWSMNGSPIPEPVVRKLEETLLAEMDASGCRLLSNIYRA